MVWESAWTKRKSTAFQVGTLEEPELELVSKELNHLAAIVHVFAGGLNFMN